MSPLYDCADEGQLLTGMRQARQAIGRGELIVIPTDTVYGVAADAFSPKAVARLLAAKGRGRQSPPPVLVAGRTTMEALVAEVPDAVNALIDAFWPGGLTIVLPSQPSLAWDLGETRGTVAVRMPAHRIARELLEETGPLAVSSANLTGKPAAIAAQEARGMLGDSVAVYLDGGPSDRGVASTIVDATGLTGGAETPIVRVLREGAITREQLREVLGDLLEPDEAHEADEATSEPAATSEPEPTPKPAAVPAPESTQEPASDPDLA